MSAIRQYDAIVIGGGAAGLMTAWQAGLRGRKVVLLERSKQLGRKILMSGGGRCNFTNLDVTPDNYLCSNPHFVKSALNQYTAWDFISEVIKHDIAYHERSHGQLFCDGKAKDILSMLHSECLQVGVDILTRCDIQSVCYQTNPHRQQQNNSPMEYLLNSNLGQFSAPALVVATGGLSIPHMDPTPFGYELAKQFGVPVKPLRATLVPFTFSGHLKEMFSRLAGVAIPATLSTGDMQFSEALLFTHRGLSGPSVLQLSNYWQSSQAITVNLLPDMAVADTLLSAKKSHPKSLARTLISTYLPKNVVLELESLWWPECSELPLADWKNSDIQRIFAQFNAWQIIPSGTEGYRTAEVTTGGVDTHSLSSKTMVCQSQPGLYFVGEVLDVTGHLGGYNFQWAWSSGFACAQAL